MSAPPPSYECAIGLVEDDRDIPESSSSCSEVSGGFKLQEADIHKLGK